MSKPDFSVVTYARNEADVIEGLLDHMVKECKKISPNYEIIFLNVPSIDNTFEVVLDYAKDHDKVYPINMNQIYGDNVQKGYQVLLGMKLAQADKIILTDSDQADPADYKKLLDKLDEDVDVVVGWRKNRKGKHGFLYNFTSWGQNTLTRILTGVEIQDKNSGIKAFSKRAAQSLVLHGRNFRDVVAQLASKGFKIDEVVVNWNSREGGIQSFSFIDRLFGGTLDFVANITLNKMNDKPIRFWGLVSLLLGLGSVGFLAIGIFAFYTRAEFGLAIFGMVAAVLLIMAFIAFITGILMEYIVDKRPFNLADYVIEDPRGIVKERLGK